MSKAVGIDLGTTNSVIAHMNLKNPKVIENQESEQWTPSVVYADDGEFLVGKQARASGTKQPENMVFSIKRFMGRDYDDPIIKAQVDSQRFPYRIEKDPRGEVMVQLRDRYFSPPEISALILDSLKKDAEASLGEEVSHAAITVPAYFGTRQKEVTRLAGRLAGLNVLRVLPEPTAAALAYGMDTEKMEDPKTVLVYDLGGGTFDVTVMFIGAGQFMDLGKSGDPYLGGDDFDNRIVDRLVRVIQDQYRLDVRTLPNRDAIMLTLKYKAEEAKIRLSRANRAQIAIPSLIKNGGRMVDIEYELEKGEFNTMIQDLVKRSVDLVYDGIKKANTTIEDIDTILMVGGSTRVPLVEEELRRMFGDKVARKEINPMLCVAQGAAIQTLMVDKEEFTPQSDPNIVQCGSCGVLNIKGRADCRACGKDLPDGIKIFIPDRAKKRPTQECPECGAMNEMGSKVCKSCETEFEPLDAVLTEKLSRPIGIELNGGGFEIILGDDLTLPTEVMTSNLHTVRSDQRRVVMPIYEGDKPVAKENQYLGTVEGDLPPGLPERTDVNVSLQADMNGTLQVTAELPTHPDVKIRAELNWKSKIANEQSIGGQGGNGGSAGNINPSTWLTDARFVLFAAAAARDEGGNFLDTNTLNVITQLAKQLADAMAIDDERNGRPIMEKLRPMVEGLLFVTVALAKLLKQDPELPRKVGMQKAEQLAKVVNRMDQLKQMGRGDEYVQVYNTELNELVSEILAILSKSGDGLANLLQKSSSSNS